MLKVRVLQTFAQWNDGPQGNNVITMNEPSAVALILWYIEENLFKHHGWFNFLFNL